MCHIINLCLNTNLIIFKFRKMFVGANWRENDYILFIMQEGLEPTKSLLVNAKEFVQKYRAEYLRLRDFKSVLKYNYKGVDYNIEDTIYLPYQYNEQGNFYYLEDNDVYKFCIDLQLFASSKSFIPRRFINDEWIHTSISGFCNGTNHLKNYMQVRHITTENVNIVDGFLIIELKNQKLCLN